MKTAIIQNTNIKKILLTITSESPRIEFTSVIVNDASNAIGSVIYSRNFILEPMDTVYSEIPLNAIDYNNSPEIAAFTIEYVTSSDLVKVKIDYGY